MSTSPTRLNLTKIHTSSECNNPNQKKYCRKDDVFGKDRRLLWHSLAQQRTCKSLTIFRGSRIHLFVVSRTATSFTAKETTHTYIYGHPRSTWTKRTGETPTGAPIMPTKLMSAFDICCRRSVRCSRYQSGPKARGTAVPPVSPYTAGGTRSLHSGSLSQSTWLPKDPCIMKTIPKPREQPTNKIAPAANTVNKMVAVLPATTTCHVMPLAPPSCAAFDFRTTRCGHTWSLSFPAHQTWPLSNRVSTNSKLQALGRLPCHKPQRFSTRHYCLLILLP